MDKVKVFLTVLTVLITVMPITVQAFLYRNDPISLVIPPSISDLFDGGTADLYAADSVNFAGMNFSLPILEGEPVLLSDKTVKLTYTFTNPLEGKISITSMSAILVCTEHNFVLSDNLYVEPVTLESHETVNLNVYCTLSDAAIEHIITYHRGQTSIDTEFKNFNVELIGISITMPHRKLGPIQLPQELRGNNIDLINSSFNR